MEKALRKGKSFYPLSSPPLIGLRPPHSLPGKFLLQNDPDEMYRCSVTINCLQPTDWLCNQSLCIYIQYQPRFCLKLSPIPVEISLKKKKPTNCLGTSCHFSWGLTSCLKTEHHRYLLGST